MNKKMWKQKEEKSLTSLFNKGLWDKEISIKMWKTEDMVRNKLKRLWLIRAEVITKPKILLFDIETAPMVVYSWWLFDQDIGINQIRKDWFMLSWSAKWLGDDKVIAETVSPKESQKQDDKRITKGLWDLVSEADIIIAHNWDKFDIRKMNTRFLKHGLWQPNRYQSIDTLKIARKNFSVSSNKLDYLCTFLWIPGKLSTGWFELWEKCVHWDRKSLKLMEDYCKNDVKILEKVYLKLRPYDGWTVNLGMYLEDGKKHCSRCGSTKLKWGWVCVSWNSRYKTSRCECWAVVRDSVSLTKKDKRKLLTK